MDGAFDTYWQPPTSPTNSLSTIIAALNATLDPRIPNPTRQQALHHLEHLKSLPDAPHTGFALADDWAQSPAVRYYGLQLLEHAVRFRWGEYSAEQTAQLRTWVKCLAGSLREADAGFVRNKVAQVWVEVGKRCWGGSGEEGEWVEMDGLLLSLWEKDVGEKGMVEKVFVLGVLEQLSEDVVNSEDAVAGLRLDVLGAALNEVVVPRGLYAEFDATRAGERQLVRSGEEGWLARVCSFFMECVKQVGDRPLSGCAVKALHVLRSISAWVNLKAAVEVDCVDCLFLPFHTQDVPLQIAAAEVLYTLLSRPYGQHWHETWLTLERQALRPDRIAMIRHAFDRTQISPGEDDEKYTLQKKMSELLSTLADAIAQHPQLLEGEKLDIPAFFDLMLVVLQSKSLVISIPVLHSWTKLMAVQDTTIIDLVFQALGVLIQTCSARLLRYEAVSDAENSDDEVVQFLLEDFDTVPERHAFLGNYRRYCVNVIQNITRTRPLEALGHVLGQMREMLETGPYTGGHGFDSATYSKTALPVLQFDAQYQVVSSALKGYAMWLADIGTVSPEDEVHGRAEKDRASVTESLQQWCYSVINMHTDDPDVAAQVLQTLVTILRTIKAEPEFVLHVVQHLLTMRLYDNPSHTVFSEAVKAFEGLRVLELQKLALTFCNELLEVYHELEPRIGVLVSKHSDDARLVWGFKAFLFMIIHRASGIDNEVRLARLQQMLKPVYESWQDPAFGASLANLHTFCESLGLDGLAEFYRTYRFAETSDWAAQQLDEPGQARQADIKTKTDNLPLRMTKSMLAATTEKLQVGSDEFEVACVLWGDVIPVVLPNLLQMLRHAQAFHNLATWSPLPDELQMVVRRTLQDRFWQSGISNESKDEFYARISGSKTSYEGFASAVRGTMRNVREQGYHVLYLMTKFEEQFYGVQDLAEPLAEALFADAGCLSANHLHPIINLTTGLVQRCPPHHRARFLPPLLTQLFKRLDAKISSEWEALGQASQSGNVEEEDLGDEMRMESVLRQLTYSTVSFVPFLLEFDRPPAAAASAHATANGHPQTIHTPATQKPTLSDLVLADPTILEPLILFCTHALRMRDTRCCITICRVFRSLVPLFQHSSHHSAHDTATPQVREFVSTEVLKSCISSLHEPYFADLQKDLAALIAQILLLYSPVTATPKEVLCSLPDVRPERVERCIARLVAKVGSERQQRALVLELLEGVRGRSIHEAGRLVARGEEGKERGMRKSGGGVGMRKSGVQERFMEVEAKPTGGVSGEVEGLEGVAGLFGEA